MPHAPIDGERQQHQPNPATPFPQFKTVSLPHASTRNTRNPCFIRVSSVAPQLFSLTPLASRYRQNGIPVDQLPTTASVISPVAHTAPHARRPNPFEISCALSWPSIPLSPFPCQHFRPKIGAPTPRPSVTPLHRSQTSSATVQFLP